MKRCIDKILLLSFFVWFTTCAMAQERRAQILLAPLPTGYGSVRSVDDEIFEGLITFNDNQGIVRVQEDRESWSFTSKKALSFQFQDTTLSRHRVFHVFDYDDKDTGFTNPVFFELLAEFKTFAVLAKIDPIQPNAPRQKGFMSKLMTSDNDNDVFQIETIFIMNDTGAIEPYLQLIEKEIEGEFVDGGSYTKKFINRNLLEEYTGAHYIELQAFAGTNDLRFNVKEDLIKILDYYKVVLKK